MADPTACNRNQGAKGHALAQPECDLVHRHCAARLFDEQLRGDVQHRDRNRVAAKNANGAGIDTILYPQEAFQDLSPFKTQVDGKAVFSDADLSELQAYVRTLQTSADLDKLSDADKQVVADRRRWALVYYALSLSTERGAPPVPSRAGFAAAR